MRPIKFRAWDTKSKNWTTCGIGYGYQDGMRVMNISADAEYPIIVMQFTGLHDKNGKEIYEGDMVSDGDSLIGVINYNEKCAAFCIDELPLTNQYVSIKSLEVIGNIYEHPHLEEQLNLFTL